MPSQAFPFGSTPTEPPPTTTAAAAEAELSLELSLEMSVQPDVVIVDSTPATASPPEPLGSVVPSTPHGSLPVDDSQEVRAVSLPLTHFRDQARQPRNSEEAEVAAGAGPGISLGEVGSESGQGTSERAECERERERVQSAFWLRARGRGGRRQISVLPRSTVRRGARADTVYSQPVPVQLPELPSMAAASRAAGTATTRSVY